MDGVRYVLRRSRNTARPTRVDLRRRGTLSKGDCEVLEGRGGFPKGFPYHVEDFGPSHHFIAIPTACGATSAAAVHPRIVTDGGVAVRDSTVSTTAIRVRVLNALRRG